MLRSQFGFLISQSLLSFRIVILMYFFYFFRHDEQVVGSNANPDRNGAGEEFQCQTNQVRFVRHLGANRFVEVKFWKGELRVDIRHWLPSLNGGRIEGKENDYCIIKFYFANWDYNIFVLYK